MPLNDSQFTRNTRVVCAFTLALLTWAMSGLASDARAQTPAASDPVDAAADLKRSL
jgi:hypothetical protein